MGSVLRLTRDVPRVIAAMLVGLVALGVVSFRAATDQARQKAHSEAAADAAAGHVGFAHAIAQRAAAADDGFVGGGVSSLEPRATVGRTDTGGLVVVQADGNIGGGIERGVGLDGIPELSSAVTTARDTGRAQVVVVSDGSSAQGVALAIAPLYDGNEPTGTAPRRQAFTGASIVRMDVSGLVDAAFARTASTAVVEASGFTIAERGSDFGTDAVLSTSIVVSGEQWTVTSFADRPGIPFRAWTYLGFALALTALGIGVASARTRRIRQIEGRAGQRERLERLIADVGPIVQASLDLGDILPAVCLRLADDFDLEGISIAIIEDTGDLRDAFLLGVLDAEEEGGAETRTDDASAGHSRAIAAREMGAVALHRTGRAVGRVAFRPRQGMDQNDMHAMHAVCGLLSTAITNARALEREQDTVRRLEELDRMKTEFLGTVSHEIRTPLTAISGFAHLLDTAWNDLDEASIRDFVQRINANSSALSAMLEQILDFARLEREGVTTYLSEFDLAEVVKETLERTSTLFAEHRIEVSIPDQLPVISDEDAVSRVLTNLLTNAVKFSPPNSTVHVALASEGERAVLVVEDEGPGVAPVDRARVFERFYRAPSDATMRTRGAGIGLAVVKELVARMGGLVSVESAAGGGARFVVSIPRDSGGQHDRLEHVAESRAPDMPTPPASTVGRSR